MFRSLYRYKMTMRSSLVGACLLFAVYVLALCALAISDPSFERGGALLLLTLGIVGLMWQMDLGIVPVERDEERWQPDEIGDLSDDTEARG